MTTRLSSRRWKMERESRSYTKIGKVRWLTKILTLDHKSKTHRRGGALIANGRHAVPYRTSATPNVSKAAAERGQTTPRAAKQSAVHIFKPNKGRCNMPPQLETSSWFKEERFPLRSLSFASSEEDSSGSERHLSSSSASSSSSSSSTTGSHHQGQLHNAQDGTDQSHGHGRIDFHSSPTEASYAHIGAGAHHDDDDSNNNDDAATATAAATLFKSPFANDVSSPGEINERLNLHLGLPLPVDQFERIRWWTRFLHTLLISWWDGLILAVLYRIPDSVLRSVIFAAWNVYLPLHRRFLHRSTGLDPSVSVECHALSTVLFCIHFAVTRVSHIRYGLHALSAARPAPPKSIVETIDGTIRRQENGRDHAVSGRFLHYNSASTTMTEYTLVWIYGGAFLSGDAHGNVGTADVLGQSCRMDVWIPDYRKAPSHGMDDISDDIAAAYQWVREKRIKAGLDPSKIVLAGWSAGAALCTRLMQSLVVDRQQQAITMPKAAVLFSPFVQYERPTPESSMRHYSLHDWMVTRNIMDMAEQTLAVDTFWNHRNEHHSPLSHSMVGLPPLCVIVSEHEAVYEQTCCLVAQARRDRVPVTTGVWLYMAHGWYMLGGLLPEGERALQFAGQFIRAQCCDDGDSPAQPKMA